jgi:hypothetical protein
VVELRLHRGNSGERGLDAAGGKRAHRRVSRAADSKAELTWHWMGHWRDGDHRTGSCRWQAVAELAAHVGRARERAKGLGRGHK